MEMLKEANNIIKAWRCGILTSGEAEERLKLVVDGSHKEKHDIIMQTVSMIGTNQKMAKAVCYRCKQESDWHYFDQAAKKELENKPCK